MSEPDSGDSAKQRKSSAKPWIISGCAVVAVAGAYFGGAAWISSQIPANTTVSGIAIGSLSQDEPGPPCRSSWPRGPRNPSTSP
ncbi:hypothetical protein [Arthrobacter sp. JCM 19049]|uniref:hypothetical protein n=1 Tax=Arthrobacter sp. JCM 19049 TaxID=1460643 RepID=UPI000AD02085|nr:hypothetical protein [Arthrobacter sp. JCM 19049]